MGAAATSEAETAGKPTDPEGADADIAPGSDQVIDSETIPYMRQHYSLQLSQWHWDLEATRSIS